MIRKNALFALTGLVLVAGLATPVFAGPITGEDETIVCVRTDPSSGQREGFCVWLPIAP